MMNAARNADFDRLIQDQRGSNGVEQSVLEGPSSALSSGSQFVDMVVSPPEDLLGSLGDLSQFYDTCGVSPQRAFRNRVGRRS